MAASASMKDYLKRYQSKGEEEVKKKNKKKKIKKPEASGVLVVDEDPVWQKPVNVEEEATESPDESPVVDEDIEVKRMRRLEQIKQMRAHNAIAEDGSGWISVSTKPASSFDKGSDISPPRRGRTRKDTPSPEPRSSEALREEEDLPPRRNVSSSGLNSDFSPTRKPRARNDTPSPSTATKQTWEDSDLSPPRKQMTIKDSRSPEYSVGTSIKEADLSPPRKRKVLDDMLLRQHRLEPSRDDTDLSSPRIRRARYESILLERRKSVDLSPPRQKRRRNHTPSTNGDFSPPRRLRSSHSEEKKQKMSATHVLSDFSPSRDDQKELGVHLSVKEKRKTGLISGTQMREEISKRKKVDSSRFKDMDPSMTGQGAEPVFRIAGQTVSKEEYLKSRQKVDEKPKEMKIEWGKGLAQKREADARLQELELEKDKPFARTRDDPELDRMMKDKVRWGDPMAHLVKRKQSELVLPDLGENERMKESGFVIPQDIPNHSWLKRGLDAASNRYGIRPGRHWDGVDRSNGFEKTLIKKTNDKKATEREAYLWSVSDM